MPRLLRCMICKTITKLPDYQGDPTQDRLLIDVCKLHEHPEAPEAERATAGMLFTIDQATYDKLEYATKMGGKLDDHTWMLDERNQLKLDAHMCWEQHFRPNERRGCSDYESPAKLLPHPAGRVMAKKDKRYLCHFCPFQAHVTHKMRVKKRMYDVN